MKKTLFLLTTATLVAFTFFSYATAEERVLHYEAAKIETPEQAVETLETKNAEIAKLLKSESLTSSNLEKIHEISYTLESAIDFMIAEKSASEDKMGAVDEAVQAVHNNSENHEEAAVREWFPKLETAVAALKTTEEAPTDTTKDKLEYKIIIKNHTFSPNEIKIPAGKKIKLIVHNQDATPEEFESDDFRREKIIAGNSTATIFVGPLKPGKYHFFGEFNLETANGYLIVE